jgi:hypothetical protein
LPTFSIPLVPPAHEMAQEEIQKQVGHLGRATNLRFLDEGARLEFEVADDSAAETAARIAELAQRILRSLRSLRRSVVYRSPRFDAPEFAGDGVREGVHGLCRGLVALEGLPLRLLRYFDRVFEEFGHAWHAEPLAAPSLIPVSVLARCDYLRSFPHSLTFACHLAEDPDRIEGFRQRHLERETVDDRALADMPPPDTALNPAMCYHVYNLKAGQELPPAGEVYGLCGHCFRYEAGNLRDLRRLWDFTLREVVFLGRREDVLARRDEAIAKTARFLEAHELAGEIRTASDPFFVAPDALAKTYFQLSAETKYEVSLLLPGSERLAVGSLNYHTDFFGRAFNVTVEGAGPMHSVCVGFGLERWVYAFLAQHGPDPRRWPGPVRAAAEVQGST